MQKKKFINPGAYSIFVNELQKDGYSHKDIAYIMDLDTQSYIAAIKLGSARPDYKLVEKTDIALKQFFHTTPKYKRHLSKTVLTYEPNDLVEWIEFHEDLEYFTYCLGWSISLWEKYVTAKLRDKSVKFTSLLELSWCVDEWEDHHIGDFNPGNRTFYSNIYKKEEDE